MATVTMTKQCACPDTSARGPRIIRENTRWDEATLKIDFSLVPMACDRCDKPWSATITVAEPNPEPT